MTHATHVEPESAATLVAPHARAFAERARKLEALPLADLALRVAEGLAGLRVSFGLEARAGDPLAALLAALPRTDMARRATDAEGRLAAALAAAADVERRSESLKEALRERSADLSLAIARADTAERSRAEAASSAHELHSAAREPEGAARTPPIVVDDAFPRAVVRAREQQALAAHALVGFDREALFQLFDAERHQLVEARRQVHALEADIDAHGAPAAMERACLQKELDALLGDLAERDRELEATRRDLAWRAREMDAVREELESVRYRLMARALVARARRWTEPGHAQERP